MRTIITTVGTSMIANYLSPDGRRKVGKQLYVPIDNEWQSLDEDLTATTIYASRHKNAIDRVFKVLKNRWFSLNREPNESASAEISSILKISNGQPCRIHLLATDTLHSVMAAELIRDWFDKFKNQYNIEVLFQRPPGEFEDQDQSGYVVKYLQAVKGDMYEKGFQNLFLVLRRLVSKRCYGKDVVFNITGGYKAVIPAMVLFAQLEDIPLYYLYESSDLSNSKLVVIDELPFGFDHAAWELLEDYISNKELREGARAATQGEHRVLQILGKYKVIDPDTLDLTHIGVLLEAYLREKTDFGKSMFGYIAELLVLEYFLKEGKKVRRGEELNSSKMAFDNYQAGDPLEVDIVIEVGDGIEEWCELKPGSEISKGVKQLSKRLEFNREILKRKVDSVRLILYVPDFFDPDQYGEQIRNAVKKMQSFPEVEFSVSYFKIPFDANSIRSPSKMRITQRGIGELIVLDLNKFV